MPKELFSFGDEEMDSAAEEGWADTERPEPLGAVGVLDRPSAGPGDIDLAEVGAGEGARRSRGGSRPTSSENRKPSPRRVHWASATALLLFVAIVAGIAISAIGGDRSPQAVNPAQAPAPADPAQRERAAAQERARLRAEGQREAERQRVARQRQQTRRQAKRRRARRIAEQRRHAQRQRQQDAAPQSPVQTYEPAPPPPPPPPETTSEPSPPPPEGDGGGGGLRDGSTSAEFGL